MAMKLIKRTIVLAENETTYGTAPTLNGTDAILVENPTHNPNGTTTLIERGGLTGSLSMPKSEVCGRLAALSFDCELKGSGAAGTPPEYAPMLTACGLTETINAGTDVTYDTQIAPAESVAIKFWDGGADQHTIVGVRGNASLTLEAGTYGKFNFEMQGHPNPPVQESRPGALTYDATEPLCLKNITMTIGGYGDWEVYSATMNMNNTISAPAALTTDFPSGYSTVEVTEWNPELVVNYAAQDIADGYDPFADMDSGTSRALTIGAIGSTGGNIFQLTAPTATITNISTGDQEGRLTYEVTYQLAESALGLSDNLVMTFT